MMLRAIETFTGMALVYFLVCLFVSSLNEWIALKLGRRGVFLDRGLRRLVPEQAIYRRLLHHPLISALYRDRLRTGHPPSYIEPASFSQALVDVVHARSFAIAGTPPPTTPLDHRSLREAIVHLRPDHPRLAQSLLPILDRAGDDYQAALRGIEAWFSASMDRVTGWYQAHTRNILLGLGLAVAVAGNIDSLALARSFWTTPAQWSVIDRLADRALADHPDGKAPPLTADDRPDHRPLDDLVTLEQAGVPIGVACLDEHAIGGSLGRRCAGAWWAGFRTSPVLKIIGWLLTALAISLGAPFWFDALSKIVSMRAAGPKPAPVGRPI